MARCDLILTDGDRPVTRLLAKVFEEHGLAVDCPEHPQALQEPQAYVQALLDRQRQTGAGMIIPVFFPEVLSSHRGEFDAIIPVDSPDTLRRLDNKSSACALAGECSIPMPRQYSCPDDVDRWPVVFKFDDGLGGAGVYFPGSRAALDNLLAKVGDVPYTLSEFIEGEDWCVDALRWDDHFESGAYRVLLPRRKGTSVLRESVDAPFIADAAARLLDAASYRGVCGMDFRRSFADGRFYFLECNPRFSGGLSSQIASGLDLPWHLWQLANGQRPDRFEFKSGILTMSGPAMDCYLQKRRAKGWLFDDPL